MKRKAFSTHGCRSLYKVMRPFFLISVLIIGACRTQEGAEVDDLNETAVLTSEQEVAGAEQPGDLNPVEAQTMVDDVTIGKKVGGDGMIAAEDQGDDMAPGDPVYITMKVGDAPAGSEVKVAWYGPGETKIKDDAKTVTQGESYMTFEATDTASWQKGDYRAEIWIGDEKVNQQDFQIVDKSETGKPPLGFRKVEVFYATDRRPTGSKEPSGFFGSERSSNLHWGTCTVSIPRDHRMGKLESRHWYLLEFSPDPSRDVVLMQVSSLDIARFRAKLQSVIARARSKDMLLFIHGYNVSFEDAARRTAQLAYDLGQEVPVFYSWPSKAEEASYPADEATVEWTTAHLVQFLDQITKVTDAQKINVVAHSMGNRALVRALLQYSQAKRTGRIRNLILTAPDIDSDTFQDLAREFHKAASHSTLYASSGDLAIKASAKYHQSPRAGSAGEKLVIMDGLDTIDATPVKTDFLAHSYYGDSRTLISDMFYLINGNLPPDKRSGLEERTLRGKKYWVFRP